MPAICHAGSNPAPLTLFYYSTAYLPLDLPAVYSIFMWGLSLFVLAGKKLARAYVVTKALNDFGEMEKLPGADTRIMKVPALLLCYWIGQAESLQTARPREG